VPANIRRAMVDLLKYPHLSYYSPNGVSLSLFLPSLPLISHQSLSGLRLNS
jgi:hypothetical protein